MSLKKIILLAGLLTVLTAATAGLHWWKSGNRADIPQPGLLSPVEELQKIVRQYRRIADTSASVAATIRIYDPGARTALQETSGLRYFRCGPGYYLRLSYLQTFCDGEWVVQLDTVNRQIGVAKVAPGGSHRQGSLRQDESDGAAGWMGGSPESFLEALFSDTARFRTTGTVKASGKERSLRLQSELNPEIRSTTLFYDTLDYRLDRAEIEWWKTAAHPDDKSNKIWLARMDYSYPPAEKMDIRRRMAAIVSINEGKVTACGVYRDYQLIVNNNGQ